MPSCDENRPLIHGHDCTPSKIDRQIRAGNEFSAAVGEDLDIIQKSEGADIWVICLKGEDMYRCVLTKARKKISWEAKRWLKSENKMINNGGENRFFSMTSHARKKWHFFLYFFRINHSGCRSIFRVVCPWVISLSWGHRIFLFSAMEKNKSSDKRRLSHFHLKRPPWPGE